MVRACVPLRARHGYGYDPPRSVALLRLRHVNLSVARRAGESERRLGEEGRECAKVLLVQGHGDEREEARAQAGFGRERAEEVRSALGEGDVVWVRGYAVAVEG